MYENPNSIRKNMLNTRRYQPEDYKINVTSLPKRGVRHKLQIENKYKIRKIVFGVGLALAMTTGTIAGIAYTQNELTYGDDLMYTYYYPGDYLFCMTLDGDAYFINVNGEHLSDITFEEGGQVYHLNAEELAKTISPDRDSFVHNENPQEQLEQIVERKKRGY